MNPVATWFFTLFIIVALCIGVYLLNGVLDKIEAHFSKKRRHEPNIPGYSPHRYREGDGRWH